MNKQIALSMLNDSISNLIESLEYLGESDNRKKLESIAEQLILVVDNIRKVE